MSEYLSTEDARTEEIVPRGEGTMELMECIEKRRSVRSFTDEPVPEDIITDALRAANLAPSAGNLQARDFVVIRDKDTIQRLIPSAHNQRFIAEAPVVIVCCANLDRIVSYGPRGRDLYCLQDVAAAVENLLLFLVARGYGSCWVGAFDEALVSRALSLPRHIRPVVILPVGRPRKEGQQPPRVGLEGLVHLERW